MDASFWHQRWECNEIGFHQDEVNPLLMASFSKLNLAKGSRVFLPLCGKTNDIAWLLNAGFRVVGAELSEIAIKELFRDLGLEPEVSDIENLRRYSAKQIDVFVGDIFDVTTALIGEVDAVYDRAALVALPALLRVDYAKHVARLAGNAPQFLITFEYDQWLMDGPPFSISAKEVEQHYGMIYALQIAEERALEGGLKGKGPAKEIGWLLISQ